MAKTFPTFRFSTKCREIGSKAKTFLTFRFITKCREIRKAVRRFSLRSGSALNVGN